MAPVQHPRHSWKSHVELPDHSWDQSRINAVTPMTFMSLKTKTIPCQSPASSVQNLDMHISDTTILHLTPSGQCVTLINLSFYESDTTFKCLNEVCYLLTLSEPDYMHAILLHCCKRKGTGLLALYLGSRQRLPVRLRTSQIITWSTTRCSQMREQHGRTNTLLVCTLSLMLAVGGLNYNQCQTILGGINQEDCTIY